MAAPPAGDKKNIVKMAYIYFQEGRWDKAIEEYKKLLAIDPEDINTHNMLGDVYVKKGSPREAYDQYSKVSTELAARGQHDKAAVVNKKIAALDPTTLPPDARTKQNLIKQTLKAETAMEQGDYQTAIDAFTEVLKLDPENIPAYGKLAELLVSKGKIAEAIQQYAVMGTAFLKNRLYKKAQESFQKIVELDPNQVEARVNLAQIFIKQGSESDAKKEFLTVAEIYFQQGDLDKAQQASQKAIEFKSIEAHYILGQILFRKKQFAESKTEFENLLRFKVSHVGALTNLGQVYLELNQLDKAQEQLTKAQKVEKDNPKVLEAMGDLQLKKGGKTEAVNLFVQVSGWYLGKKDLKRAVEAARKAETADPQSSAALKALGMALKEEGQKVEAAQFLQRAVESLEKAGKKTEAEALQKQFQEEAWFQGAGGTPAPTAKQEPASAKETAAVPPTVAVKTEPAKAEPAKAQPPKSEAAKTDAPKVDPTPAPVSSAPKAGLPETSDNILDLEDDVAPQPKEDKPVVPPVIPPVAAAAPPPVAHSPAPAQPEPAESDSEAELKSQLEIAQNYVSQNLVEEAIEIYQQLLETYPNHPEVRAKLNEAYTLYVKSGEEVLGALEEERKAKEEEEKRLREDIERRAREERERKERAEADRRAREEAERRAREEAELRAREEALQRAKEDNERKIRDEMERRLRDEQDKKSKEESERKLREEMETKVRAEMEKKVREDFERKAHEDADRKAREEAERRAHEEADRKAREEAERKARETSVPKSTAPAYAAQKSAQVTASSKGESVGYDSKDDFMTIAVADIYVRQGLFEEAFKIYNRIVEMEPDNFEARKKLTDLENLIKAKGVQKNQPPSQALPAAPHAPHEPSAPHPPQDPAAGDKDSVAKKKPGKVGYV